MTNRYQTVHLTTAIHQLFAARTAVMFRTVHQQKYICYFAGWAAECGRLLQPTAVFYRQSSGRRVHQTNCSEYHRLGSNSQGIDPEARGV